jgi:hypothetical protein
MGINLSTPHYVDSEIDAIEYAHAQGWTDGLPVIPPTRERIDAVLTMWGYVAEEEVGRVTERQRIITAENVATNMIMAGCTHDMFPVVLASTEAILDDRYNIIGPSASTGGAAPLIMIHGPMIDTLGFNTGTAVLGAGNRANLTVGRALNLLIRNAIGSVPGDLDQATIAHAGRIAYCLPEGATGDWPNISDELGIPEGTNAVTVFAAEAPHSVADHTSNEPNGLIASFSRILSATNYTGAAIVFLLCPEHRAIFQGSGWSKNDVRHALFQNTKIQGHEIYRTGRHDHVGPDELLSIVPAQDDILIICAGGLAGGHSAIIPPWLGSGRGDGSKPVTKGVGVCLDC